MMRNVVFVAPFPLDTTMRFVRAAAGLADVRLLGVLQEPPRGDDAGLFVEECQDQDVRVRFSPAEGEG
jgi:hypothetical protein